MKKCSKCLILQSFENFYKDVRYKDNYTNICRSCSKESRRKRYLKNKDKELKQCREYRKSNKEKTKKYHKKWYIENRETKLSKNKKWKDDNLENYKEYQKIYTRNKRRNNKLFNLQSNLRGRINSAFRKNSWKKDSNNKNLLGADWKTAFSHIESTFSKGMCWDNQGDWHIDHIIPLSAGRTVEELKLLCHYTNLQALWAEDNLKKGGKYNKKDLIKFLNKFKGDK